jgi:hypothetical protein
MVQASHSNGRAPIVIILLTVATMISISVAGLILVSSSVTPEDFIEQIDGAFARWTATEITDYRLTVLVSERPYFEAQHTVTVADGEIVDYMVECIIAPDSFCDPDHFNPAEYTVRGLFSNARRYAERVRGGVVFYIDFHLEYHYPEYFGQSRDDVEDALSEWRVTDFEVIQVDEDEADEDS